MNNREIQNFLAKSLTDMLVESVLNRLYENSFSFKICNCFIGVS